MSQEQREFQERLRRGNRDCKEHSVSMAVAPEQAAAFNEHYRRHGITGAHHDPQTGVLHMDTSKTAKKVEDLRGFINRDGVK
jgi:hypothetical protein